MRLTARGERVLVLLILSSFLLVMGLVGYIETM